MVEKKQPIHITSKGDVKPIRMENFVEKDKVSALIKEARTKAKGKVVMTQYEVLEILKQMENSIK